MIRSIHRRQCDEETTKLIAQNIKIGLTNRDAAIMAGVNPATMQIWLRRGYDEKERIDLGAEPQESEAKYLDFYLACQAAVPQRKEMLLQVLYDSLKERRYTEIRTETETSEDGFSVERRVIEIEKVIAPDVKTAKWLLERLHPDEFGPQKAVQKMWMQEVIDLLRRGEINAQDVVNEFGYAIARDIFHTAGLPIPASLTLESKGGSPESGDTETTWSYADATDGNGPVDGGEST